MHVHFALCLAVIPFCVTFAYVHKWSFNLYRICTAGLPSHPQHELAKRQMKGFGGMVSFRIKGTLETAKKFIDSLKVSTAALQMHDVSFYVTYKISTCSSVQVLDTQYIITCYILFIMFAINSIPSIFCVLILPPQLVTLAESLGGVESLVEIPWVWLIMYSTQLIPKVLLIATTTTKAAIICWLWRFPILRYVVGLWYVCDSVTSGTILNILSLTFKDGTWITFVLVHWFTGVWWLTLRSQRRSARSLESLTRWLVYCLVFILIHNQPP